MRKKFYGWYSPSDVHFQDMWDNGIIVFDTNVLLSLYRYCPETRDLLFSVMEHFSDHLWLPYHVGGEFHTNRIKTVQSLNNEYIEASNEIDNFLSKFSSIAEKDRADSHISLKDIERRVQKYLNKVKQQIEGRKEQIGAIIRNDEILERISNIFDGKVGENFLPKRILEIEKEGETRFKNKIPPGYMDLKKGNNENSSKNVYGDLFIWFQLIEHAKKVKTPIIFVTEDLKEDWWWLLSKGEKIGPRPELIEEMEIKAGVGYYSYSVSNFLNYAKQKMVLNESKFEAALKDIEQVRADIEENEDVWDAPTTNTSQAMLPTPIETHIRNPDLSPTFAEVFKDLPDASNMFVEAFKNLPDPSNMFVEAFKNLPDTSKIFVEAFKNLPDPSNMFVEAFKNLPDTSKIFVEACKNLPDTSNMFVGAFKDLPDYSKSASGSFADAVVRHSGPSLAIQPQSRSNKDTPKHQQRLLGESIEEDTRSSTLSPVESIVVATTSEKRDRRKKTANESDVGSK